MERTGNKFLLLCRDAEKNIKIAASGLYDSVNVATRYGAEENLSPLAARCTRTRETYIPCTSYVGYQRRYKVGYSKHTTTYTHCYIIFHLKNSKSQLDLEASRNQVTSNEKGLGERGG